jgi:hypothetical protein
MEKNKIFNYLGIRDESEINELENENDMLVFYGRCMDNDLDIADADRYAILNTLIGYDIGIENALNIINYLWEKDIDVYDLSCDKDNKKCVQEAIKSLCINIDMSNWKDVSFTHYEYHV